MAFYRKIMMASGTVMTIGLGSSGREQRRERQWDCTYPDASIVSLEMIG